MTTNLSETAKHVGGILKQSYLQKGLVVTKTITEDTNIYCITKYYHKKQLMYLIMLHFKNNNKVN